MLSVESFWTTSLRASPQGEGITRILAAAIASVEPGAAVRRFVRRREDTLTISGREYNLRDFQRVALLGLGKASLDMSAELVELLGETLSTGLVISKQDEPVSHPPVTFIRGGHPIPDEHSLCAGERTKEMVSSLGPQDLLICAISGGGSALVTAPVAGVSLADFQILTSVLVSCGAPIDEINILRRHLDLIKGGGLVRMANGATIVSLILSDVVGNHLEAIASGPTAPDPTSRIDALTILKKYGLEDRIPVSMKPSLLAASETLKPGDQAFEKVQNIIIGSNLQAAQAALKQAEAEGFHPYLIRTDMHGEAREAAFELVTYLRQAKLTGDPLPPPACIVAGGETTVRVIGTGKGGRNTELALAAVSEMAGFPGVMLVSLATDGEDGTTGAAGALVTGETFQRAAELGLIPGDFLARNDSFSFFSALGDLLLPGPTGTNVNDLVIMFIF
jgi:hydroxypyruvate reductase